MDKITLIIKKVLRVSNFKLGITVNREDAIQIKRPKNKTFSKALFTQETQESFR